jgi:hypothetical protein
LKSPARDGKRERSGKAIVAASAARLKYLSDRAPGSDGETVSGTIRTLCSDRYTDSGEGAACQSTWLDIAA